MHVTLTHCCREKRQSSSPGYGHPINRIWIRWTSASGESFKRGSAVRGSM